MPVNPPDPTAFPVIKINSSTGSDTTASGAGPSTLITGVLAATHTNTTVNITDAVALGGVALDGTAALWVSSSSGRRWSKITNITGTSGNWVVTVGAAYGNTESGRTWGIGGKRATAAGSAQLFAGDWGVGWWVDQQTSETISSTITMTAPAADGTNPPPLYTSTTTTTTWGSQPVIDSTTNSLAIFKAATVGIAVANLAFKQTSGTPGYAFQAAPGSGGDISWTGCIFDGFNMALDGSAGIGGFFTKAIIQGCEVKNCTGTSAISFNNAGTGDEGQVIDCYCHNNVGVYFGGSSSAAGAMIVGNVFANNTGAPTVQIGTGNTLIKNNTFYNCGSGTTSGAIATSVTTPGSLTHENNIYYGNPGYGLVVSASTLPPTFVNRNNAYGGNNGGGTGLDVKLISYGPGDVTGISNPFVSSSDFGLNNTAGAGALCRGAATGVPNASANTAGDLGAIPSGGGGSGTTGATAFAF